MPFTPEQKRAYRARRKAEGNPVKNPRPASRMRSEHAYFVAFDSEGVTREDGTHITVLWAAGWFRHGRWHYRELVNPDGIAWNDAYDWILSVGRENRRLGINIIFGGSYDSNMLLRHLSLEQARRLHKFGSVWTDKYNVSYMLRRKLTISQLKDRDNPYRTREITKKDGTKEHRRILDVVRATTIYDVIGFFQSNFLGAIEGFLGPNYPDLELIKAGKFQRSDFDAEQLGFIRDYTTAELQALCRVMWVLRNAFRDCNLHIRQWLGAGSAARALLEAELLQFHYPPEQPAPQIRDILYRAYFGGRIETMGFGRQEGPISHADINSAYPAAMADLPSMREGRWVLRATDDLVGAHFAAFHIRWALRSGAPLYPFPFREGSGPKKGGVFFPRSGEGWYWRPEVEQAIAAHGIAGIDIIEVLEWVADDGSRPFSVIQRYYERRQQIIAEFGKADMREKALKLALNSVYGKLAQTLGGQEDSPPKFHNLAWAGWITSWTRAKLYAAAMLASDRALSIATDGIWFSGPLPALETSDTKELGKWEADELEELVVLQPGFYWYRKSGEWSVFCRGVEKPARQSNGYQQWIDDARERTLAAWRAKDDFVPFATNRFLTLGSAIAGEDRFKSWCRWEKGVREISTWPTGKRTLLEYGRPAERWVRSAPASPMSVLTGEMSAPYDPKWSQDLREENELLAEEEEML